ncbi:3,4-dihydroxy-2-butanone-4-phosphate synthase [Amycolatopsis silviterrae]|uniref:3,4-dihydroxy-2-butanone-4-phosphate synthase n=1 Tax=Amycolatopsis silviterrae TaxID=1656914 RepID=A0ABW5H2I6_9PSEU
MTSLAAHPVDAALSALATGRPMVLSAADAALILPAAKVSTTALAFVVRHSSGLVSVALPGDRCDALELPPMCPSFRAGDGPAWCVAVDAATGVTTGISAADRAETIRRLADPATVPQDLHRPGHVLPCATHPQGILGRLAIPEAAVDLCLRAGHSAAAVFAGLVSPSDPRRMATPRESVAFAAEHGLPVLDLSDAVRNCQANQRIPRSG